MQKEKFYGSIEEVEEEYKGEVIDCVEGCLLDSVLIDSASGYIALIETYQNEWTSAYMMYSGDNDEVYSVWEDYRDLVEKGE